MVRMFHNHGIAFNVRTRAPILTSHGRIVGALEPLTDAQLGAQGRGILAWRQRQMPGVYGMLRIESRTFAYFDGTTLTLWRLA